MIAWKKHNPNTNLWYISGLDAVSKYSFDISNNDLFKFAFNPLGGSVVNFIPFYNILTGKYDAGIDVKNNL